MTTTQLEHARAGAVTPQVKAVAAMEDFDPIVIRDCVAAGHIVIPNKALHDIVARRAKSCVQTLGRGE